jgi:hypothetical protein
MLHEGILFSEGIPFHLVIPPLTVTAVTWSLAWINRSWAGRLKPAATAEANEAPWMRFSLAELMGAITLIACMTALVSYFIRTQRPQFAEHVSPQEAGLSLPEGAHDVSYGRGIGDTIAYEFSTDEASFRAWVESGIGSIESNAANVPIKPISEPVTVMRFLELTPVMKGPKRITVHDGLYYAWSKEDRRVDAVFDRKTQRAYFQYHGY